MAKPPKTPRPESRRPAALGLRSTEALHHFQCGACERWWSIGDAPPRSRWYCPWCGRENQFRTKR